MSRDQQPLSIGEKVGYSLGDAAANVVFMTMILYQQKFYTDTFGLTLGAASAVLLAGRIWDAFFDPLMGTIADRTNTRWGKFRPWILATAIPWGAAMYFAFTTPHLSSEAKLAYAIVTNIALMTLYSANNTPYSALMGVMTDDGHERTVLSSYRFGAAMTAQLIIGGFTLPLVAKLGQGNDALGWQRTMALWAVACIVLFVITFAATRERIKPNPQQTPSARKDLANLLRNGPWIAMFLLTLAHFLMLAMRGGTLGYYFDYYLNQDELYAYLESWGLTRNAAAPGEGGFGTYLMGTFGLLVNPDKSNVAAVGFSLFNILSQFITLVGVLASAALAARLGKRGLAVLGFSLTAILTAAFFFIPADDVRAVYWLEWIRALSYAPTIPLLWAMFADVADYAEWTTGRRTTGIIFATILFALKVGLSLGSACSLWLLDWHGYAANQVQSASALYGIRMIVSVYSAIALGVCIVCLSQYKISRDLNVQIQNDLAERRKAYA